MDTLENESIYRVSPEPQIDRHEERAIPLRAWEELLGKLDDLSRSVGAFNATAEQMRGELSFTNARLEKLEHSSQQERKTGRKKPYTVPQRRPQGAKTRAVSTFPFRRSPSTRSLISITQHTVRKEIDALLNAHGEDPFVSKEEADRFSKSQGRFPSLRCCDPNNFRLDINGGTRSPWNRSLELTFVEAYTEKHQVPEEDVHLVSQAFYTRIKSIKASRTVTESQKASKVIYIRKYGVGLSHSSRTSAKIDRELSYFSVALRLSPSASRCRGTSRCSRSSQSRECQAMKRRNSTSKFPALVSILATPGTSFSARDGGEGSSPAFSTSWIISTCYNGVWTGRSNEGTGPGCDSTTLTAPSLARKPHSRRISPRTHMTRSG